MQVGDDMENVEEICSTKFQDVQCATKFHLSPCDECDNEELGTSPSFSYTNNIITKNENKKQKKGEIFFTLAC